MRLSRKMQGCTNNAGKGAPRLAGAAFVLALLMAGVIGTAFVFADSSHGGDFTWRNQTVIRVLRVPVYICGVLVVLLTAVSGYLNRWRRERWSWLLGFCIMTVTVVIATLRVHPLDSEILSWNANVPPSDWQEIRARRAMWYVFCVGFGLAGFLPIAIRRFCAGLKREVGG